MLQEDKPMLSVEEQIQHLQSKGVKFEIMSVEEATTYLRENNNYFKLRAYRKNFPKHPDGLKKGQYIDLDFGQLKDLAIIDMRMRYTFLQLALDIEHYAKVHLLHIIEASPDDGYNIVQRYWEDLELRDSENNGHRAEKLRAEIKRNKENPYCGGLISYYGDTFPVWVFVEIITMGNFVDFYYFCASYLGIKEMFKEYYLLLTIKQLRNATAHNNCLIHNMGAKEKTTSLDYDMMKKLTLMSKTSRKTQLKNERMHQIVTLIYAHSVFVTSQGVRGHTRCVLEKLTERMFQNIDMYSNVPCIINSFTFFKKTVDIFTKCEYTTIAIKK